MHNRLRIGVLMPGFSSDENDLAIPVQLNLAREQAQHVDYRILALRYPHRRDRYRVAGAEVQSLGYGAWTRGAGRGRLWIGTLRTLDAMHRERPFDVLHAMWADETGMIAGWFGRWRKIPVVVSVNGGEIADLRDIGYGGQLSFWARWMTARAFATARVIIIPSDYAGRLLSRAYPSNNAKIQRLPFGVDEQQFSPAQAFDPRRLICVASLIPVKDHATLFKAVARIEHVTLDVVGSGTLLDGLMQQANRLGIGERVNFVGSVRHEQLPAYYQRAALHVMSSRHETFALSVAEAAACGVPSVTTAVGMLPDYPDIGVTVPVGDDAALAEAIRAMLDEPTRLAQYRESARATIERELTIAHTAARLREVYASLV